MLSIQASPFVPGRARGTLRSGAPAAAPGTIVLLRQADITTLAARPAGIILVEAAPLSHPALRLLSRGIPTVLLDEGQLAGLHDGMDILLDGHSGLLASPVPEHLPDIDTPPSPLAGVPVHTLDGVAVELRCSVTNAEGAIAARSQGATALGLVRTEYLFPADGSVPDAAFLAQAMAEVCQAARPLTVTFRLLDIAGDKRPPWLGHVPGIAGVLGLQGARLYGIEPVRGVYLTELRALAELAGRYPIRVLLPYVVALAELETLVTEIRGYLPESVPVGTMLETPAAALSAREFLEVADFAALGCNDLMQCLYAADRDMPELRGYLDTYAPPIFRILELVAHRSANAMHQLQVNGLFAQRPGVLPALLGMGFRNFSIDPVMLSWLAESVRHTDTTAAAKLAKSVCQAGRPETIRRLLTSR